VRYFDYSTDRYDYYRRAVIHVGTPEQPPAYEEPVSESPRAGHAFHWPSPITPPESRRGTSANSTPLQSSRTPFIFDIEFDDYVSPTSVHAVAYAKLDHLVPFASPTENELEFQREQKEKEARESRFRWLMKEHYKVTEGLPALNKRRAELRAIAERCPYLDVFQEMLDEVEDKVKAVVRESDRLYEEMLEIRNLVQALGTVD
jgi:hypothetical protein